MAASFAWGFLAAVPLIVGGAVALQYRVGERTLGLVMAFGSGVLISAVAFELVQEAWDEGAHAGVGLGLFAGSLTFWAGDALIARRGGGDRKHSGGRQAEGSPLAIVLGTILDGVPESIVLGLTLVSKEPSAPPSSSRSRSRTSRRRSPPRPASSRRAGSARTSSRSGSASP